MCISLVFLSFCLHGAILSQAQVATTMPAINLTTVVPPFSVSIQQTATTPTTITVKWFVPTAYEASEFNLTWRQIDQSDNHTVHFAPGPTYEISDLARDMRYEVCITARHVESGNVTSDCLEMHTVPLIRKDNLIIVIIVIIILLILVVGGIIAWCCARKQDKKTQTDEEVGLRNGEEKQHKQTAPNNLAAPSPTSDGPSFDKEDIPFITPPVHELNRDEKMQYEKAQRV